MLLMAGVCGNAFAEANENIVRQGTIRGRVIDNGKPVSYTHLDVYKRHLFDCSKW